MPQLLLAGAQSAIPPMDCLAALDVSKQPCGQGSQLAQVPPGTTAAANSWPPWLACCALQGVLSTAAERWPHIHISDSLVMADKAVKMVEEGCT